MSQRIAPGKWEASKRQDAKRLVRTLGALAFVVGVFGGAFVGVSETPGVVPLLAFGIMTLVGMLMLVPSIAVPLAYKLIDRFGKDAPE